MRACAHHFECLEGTFAGALDGNGADVRPAMRPADLNSGVPIPLRADRDIVTERSNGVWEKVLLGELAKHLFDSALSKPKLARPHETRAGCPDESTMLFLAMTQRRSGEDARA